MKLALKKRVCSSLLDKYVIYKLNVCVILFNIMVRNYLRGYTMKNKYQKTVYVCFVGYIVQAIVNNFVPLLFLTF